MEEKTLLDVLRDYPRAVVHLRRQFEAQRFGLVLGAGISKGFNVPGWGELVKSISTDPEVKGDALLSGKPAQTAMPYQIELLWRHFRRSRLGTDFVAEREKENSVYAQWLRICANHLYESSQPDIGKAIASHPYLADLLPLVRGSHITVTLNFDDYVEQALNKTRKDEDRKTRGYETVTNPWTQFRRQDSVIYHLHGFIPRKLMELPADRFVFSETGYAKQYVGADGHDSSFLLSHFSRHTCLILGCSLEDVVRNVLMRCAFVSPGNYHYYVQHIENADSLSRQQRDTIRDTNFNVYNLITLFLTTEQIAALLKLLSKDQVPDAQLGDLATQCGVRLRYHFYLTGPLGVGKSTTSSLLRNLLVLDEWLEARPDVLGKPWDQLSPDEERDADNWIDGQFRAKNDTLRHHSSVGLIAIVDRPPIDPLAFVRKEGRQERAKRLLNAICPGRTWEIAEGTVILLKGHHSELAARVKASGREDYTSERLARMQNDLLELYDIPKVKPIDTQGLSILEVTKKVAELIHFEPYEPCNLMLALQKIAGEKQ